MPKGSWLMAITSGDLRMFSVCRVMFLQPPQQASAILILLLLIHAIPAQRGKVRPADKLQVEAAKCLPLVGLARSKQDPINRGHGAQYLYRPPTSQSLYNMEPQIKKRGIHSLWPPEQASNFLSRQQ